MTSAGPTAQLAREAAGVLRLIDCALGRAVRRTLAVGEDVNARRRAAKHPRLAVVRVGNQDGGPTPAPAGRVPSPSHATVIRPPSPASNTPGRRPGSSGPPALTSTAVPTDESGMTQKRAAREPSDRLGGRVGRACDGAGDWGGAGDRGCLIESTVLTDTTLDMTVVREEIFGPVVCVIGLRLRGRRRHPQRQRHELRPRVGDLDARPRQGAPDRPPLRAGAVWINCYSVFDAAMPIRRLQGVGLGPGDGPQRVGELPRNQARGDPARVAGDSAMAGAARRAAPPSPIEREAL